MHIESALRGVKEEDRCPNWKEGYYKPCGEVKSGGGFMSFFGM
jgi:hypothetical protein